MDRLAGAAWAAGPTGCRIGAQGVSVGEHFGSICSFLAKLIAKVAAPWGPVAGGRLDQRGMTIKRLIATAQGALVTLGDGWVTHASVIDFASIYLHNSVLVTGDT